MTVETVIAPLPPEDGRDWECQCARCGSSVATEDLSDGGGVWRFCLSSAEWCEANPLPAREQVLRGEIEWFVIQREARHG